MRYIPFRIEGVPVSKVRLPAPQGANREENMSAFTSGLHHLGFTVSDLAAARGFFVEALGHQVVGEVPDYPAVFVSDGTTMITLWQVEDPATATGFDRRKNIGLHHAAFLVQTEALPELFDKVSTWPGVTVDAPISGVAPGMDASHFVVFVPGGPRVEFLCSPAVAA